VNRLLLGQLKILNGKDNSINNVNGEAFMENLSLNWHECEAKRIYEILNEGSNLDLIQLVEVNLSVLIQLIDSLHKDEICFDEFDIWMEPLLIKFCFHSATLIEIIKGVNLPNGNRPIAIFDEPSLIAISRIILENYLTWNYLYINPKDKEQSVFRNAIWQYSALLQRSDFKATIEYAKNKRQFEIGQIKRLREIIENSTYWYSYTDKQKQQILKGKKPRLFFSWQDLIANSELNKDLLEDVYSYKSSYAHSEFLSVMQIKQGGFEFNKESRKSKHHIEIHLALISKIILDLESMFPTIQNRLFSMPKAKGFELRFLPMFLFPSYVEKLSLFVEKVNTNP